MGGCIVAVQLIRTIQIVHPFESASEAEFLKEFFRFLGCLVYDRPSPEAWNVESLSQSDAIIFLNYPMESQYGFSSGSICVYLSFDFSAQNSEVYVWKTLEGTTLVSNETHSKATLESQILEHLISKIWKDFVLDAKCIQKVRELYLANNLYPLLQYKRAFRVLRMGEAIDANIGISKITPEHVIVEMLRAFWYVYAVLRNKQHLSAQETLPEGNNEDGRSVYGVYACVNAGRCLRQVCLALRYLPDDDLDCIAAVEKEGLSPEEVRFTVCSAQTLIEQLKILLAKDKSFLAAYLLAASISKTSRDLEFAAREYYSYILAQTHPSDIYYAFIQYELGNYYEKIGGNISAAVQYFKQALDQDDNCYQAQYKVSCYDARAGRYQEAEIGFMRVTEILFCGRDSDTTANWEQLSLKRTQYAFKSYIWLAKIAYNYYRSTAMVTEWVSKAFQAAKMYQASWLLRRSIDFAGEPDQEESSAQKPQEATLKSGTMEWATLQGYHRHSEPMHVLWLVLYSWVDGVIQDEYLQTLVKRELKAFETSAGE